MFESSLPFHPHPWIRGGHAQTLAGAFWPESCLLHDTVEHRIVLADGDQLALHENRALNVVEPARAVLLVHGLSGSRHSRYVQRLAARVVECGATAWRMELRGCGAGEGLARRPYHAGLSSDVGAVVEYVTGLNPAARLTLVGYSLGGNLVLKLLGEWGASRPEQVELAAAVCPPTDLLAGSQYLRRPLNRWYDRYFAGQVTRRLTGQAFPSSMVEAVQNAPPRTLAEFDDRFTAPLSGFSGVEEYYRTQAAGPLLEAVTVPTLIVAAADDPVVPANNFSRWPVSPQVRVEVLPTGGHLGFIAAGGSARERRWLDRRLVNWWGGRSSTSPDSSSQA